MLKRKVQMCILVVFLFVIILVSLIFIKFISPIENKNSVVEGMIIKNMSPVTPNINYSNPTNNIKKGGIKNPYDVEEDKGCPISCDDGNESTIDYCNFSTNYQCIHDEEESIKLQAFLTITSNKEIAPAEILFDASDSTSGVKIVQYTFSFGDGTLDYVETLTDNDGVFNGRAKHTYSIEGNFTVRVEVIDDSGAKDSKSLSILIESKSDDKNKIIFQNEVWGNKEIYSIYTEGIGLKNLTNYYDNPFDDDYEPSFSPDGTQIVFVSSRELGESKQHTLWIMNAEGSNQVRLTNQGTDRNPAWSPDGKYIAFDSERDWYSGTKDIYLINLDTSEITRLTNDSALDANPTWSPDGTQIAFSSSMGSEGNRIYIMNADGSNLEKLTSGKIDNDPTWSPDGTQIVFSSYQNKSYGSYFDIYVMNADGSNQIRLTSGLYTMTYTSPSWSPDGTQIAFEGQRGHLPSEIYIMNVDGSGEPKKLTEGKNPVWFPQ